MTEARRLGRFGIWRSASLVTPEFAAGIERLGFGALWLGSSPAGDLRRLGWTGDDLSGSGSDALVAHGSPAAIAAQLTRHLDAGADHVCLHLITEQDADPLPGYRALAPAPGLS